MQVAEPNNIKIYSVTSASKSALPEWLARKNREHLKHDSSWRNRIELIQDFEFPEASLNLQQTPDGNYLMGTGVYQPQIRVWELSQLSCKFARHTSAENVKFETVHLQSDRTVEFHSHYGAHYSVRIPKFGRDLKYHFPSCDLMAVGGSNQVWRINLEQGRFLSALETNLPEINAMAINPAHQLLGFGGIDGMLELWDHRQHKNVGTHGILHDIIRAFDNTLIDSLPQVTSVEFDNDGLTFCVGMSTGQIARYDLRSRLPILLKDHQYGYPIKSLTFHSTGNVLSADTKIVKIWNKNTGNIFTTVECPTDINDVSIGNDTGLLMLTNEGTQIQSYYIPALGPAPKWCPFLDNLTEELEENPNIAIYDDYKFVTKKELQLLGLDHLLGTNILKAYMHGFFVDLRLYEKAKAIANPYEREQHRKQLVQQKIQEKRASRISASRKLPKVNQALAEKLCKSDSDGEQGKKRKKTTFNPMQDSRFSAMFEDNDFQVDETTHEYRLHHPSTSAGGVGGAAVKARFEPSEQVELVEDPRYLSDPEGNASDSSNEERYKKEHRKRTPKDKAKKSIKLYQLKDDYSSAIPDKEDGRKGLPFGSRIAKGETNKVGTLSKKPVGNQSITFESKSKPRRK